MNDKNIFTELRVMITKDKKILTGFNGDTEHLIYMLDIALHEILKIMENNLNNDGLAILKEMILYRHTELLRAENREKRAKILNGENYGQNLQNR